MLPKLTRVYEVECAECTLLLGYERTRQAAIEVWQQHVRATHPGGNLYMRGRLCACGCGQYTSKRTTEYKYGHKPFDVYLKERLRVTKGGCWELGLKPAPHGYVSISRNGITVRAHRAVYEHFKGSIPAGLVLDHLCRNTLCVNPDHLDPVTNRVNILRGQGLAAENSRKTHCIKGHAYTEDNTGVDSGGGRYCKTCSRESTKRSRERRKGSV